VKTSKRVKAGSGRSRSRPARTTRAPSYDTVLRLALALPGVEEGTSYGTPSLRVAGRFIARLREDGDLAIRAGFEEREMLMAAHPEAFHVTAHYLNYPAVLVRLSKVREEMLREVVENAWRRVAPKRLRQEYDARRLGGVVSRRFRP
jgi:hypothetical protein